MNESETRAEHIDPALAKAGWGVVEGSRVRREQSAYQITPGRIQGGGKRRKAEIADYVLEYRNHRLAVIEAKAWDKPHTDGVAQAKSYAGKLKVRFTYSTNGQKIYGIDMDTGKEGDVPAFPSPDELWAMTFAEANAWRDRLADVPFEDKGGSFQGRYYQDIAIDSVLEALCAGRDRILLTLATGTGKTFIAFQLAWKLFHARWNVKDWKSGSEPTRRPRILFLADRNILADQAYNAFSAFEDAIPGSLVRIAPDEIRKKGKVPTNGNIFFTIFQTFMSGEGETPYFGDYPADFFDFIIIDECHRGGAKDESTWRAILDYFKPAVQLGLTATPKRKTNADTYAYFGEPVYSYSLKDGINDGFLTPFRVRQIASTIDDYTYTPDDSIVKGEVETGKWYEEKDFNKIIIIPEREQFRVKTFMEMIDQREKTLVFCATQKHALMVRDFINQIKTSSDPNYCVRVTAEDGSIGDQFLRDFQDNEKSIPTILTTSQKLSTGVDARNVRNIVLMRPVNSMIEFKQIIGRGTRLYDGKDYFTIYDFVKAHKHFADPEWDGEPVEPDACNRCGEAPCICAKTPCADCGMLPCECEKPACKKCGQRPCICTFELCKKCGRSPCACKIEVKLADGKARKIQSMSATSFIGPDGRPMSSAQFLEHLYGKLPELFKDEDELRRIWSDPDTRAKLIDGLTERGFDRDIMAEMQKLVDAENSDLFDVLAHVAYAYEPKTREQRAEHARTFGFSRYSDPQREFLDFILSQYEAQGIDELATDRLSKLLVLKYHALQDATEKLKASPAEIRSMYVGIQKYLYSDQ